ncbi:MAG: hypothetical protein EB020_15440 [Proteobacteria bacterium]|nr:hypothetical protein [Pseudomonadota bacterium]
MGAAVSRGELHQADLELHQKGACPTCGACQFMGSASTGQVLAEALGLALPGSALIPAPLAMHLRIARAAGKQILKLIEMDLRPSRILTREAFENAIVAASAIRSDAWAIAIRTCFRRLFLAEDCSTSGQSNRFLERGFLFRSTAYLPERSPNNTSRSVRIGVLGKDWLRIRGATDRCESIPDRP